MSNAYTNANTIEREHLIALANRLTDDQLSHPLRSGWTVAGIFAHLAWWDLRGLTLLRKWKAEGISPSPIDIDITNEVTRHLCVAMEPRKAVHMAIDAAVEIDQEIDQLDPAMLQNVATIGTTVHLDRASHRWDHLTKIERALSLPAAE